MKIRKSTMYGFIIMILIVGLGLVMVKPGSSGAGVTGAVIGAGSGEVQEVVLGMKNYNYYPNTVTVKAGQPVRISLDDSVYGCFRDFTMRDFGINEYLVTPQDSVEFTPTEPGRYVFACSMNMGSGTLVVE